MRNWKKRAILAFAFAVLAAGCSGQKQTQLKVAELENKAAENERKLAALDSDLKKASFEIAQLKNVVSRLGDVVVNLQRAGESRQSFAMKRSIRDSTTG